jgi:hypothetical protein
MGQFASRHYDGDPYIELMRALPDRELIWWVQKAIWVSEPAAAAAAPLAPAGAPRLGPHPHLAPRGGSGLVMARARECERRELSSRPAVHTALGAALTPRAAPPDTPAETTAGRGADAGGPLLQNLPHHVSAQVRQLQRRGQHDLPKLQGLQASGRAGKVRPRAWARAGSVPGSSGLRPPPRGC